jgi:hypothetical protein
LKSPNGPSIGRRPSARQAATIREIITGRRAEDKCAAVRAIASDGRQRYATNSHQETGVEPETRAEPAAKLEVQV